MCLSRVFTDEEMEEWLADKPEVIEVIKPALVFDKQWSSPCGNGRYCGGLNIANKKMVGMVSKYWSGYHFTFNETWAKRWAHSKIITCLIKKEWITAIGPESYGEGTVAINIVTSQAIFPHYPETEARLEDVPQEEVAIGSKA